MAMRKMGSIAKPDVIITRDGDKMNIKTESTFKTSECCFKIGEPFDEDTIDGRKTKVKNELLWVFRALWPCSEGCSS